VSITQVQNKQRQQMKPDVQVSSSLAKFAGQMLNKQTR